MPMEISVTEVWEFANVTVSKRQIDKIVRVIGLLLGTDIIAFFITKLDLRINKTKLNRL